MDTLEQHMDNLSKFLKSTWIDTKQFRYRVYMAQKCLNLNEHFCLQEICFGNSSVENKNYLTKVRNETFISQYALLLKADELVEYYTTHHMFPPICIVDELILSGHDFCSLMYRMLEVIFDAWQCKYGDIGQEQYWVIRDAFLNSVTYKVYARSQDAPLLDHTLPSIGKPIVMNTSEWHKYTDDVVNLINESTEVENTSFIPTLRLPVNQYESIFCPSSRYLSGWYNRLWKYDELQFDVWQKSIVRLKNDVHFHLAFVCKKADDGETVHVTPYVFWGKLSDSLVDALFKRLSTILGQQQTDEMNALAEICAIPYRSATNSKLRFLFALICILELLELSKAQTNIQIHNLEKIAQCFGTIMKICPALLKLCEKDSATVRKQLRDTIYETMWDAPTIGIDTTDSDRGDTNEQSDYLQNAENYFIQVDYFERKQVQLRRAKNSPFVPWSDFFYEGGCLSNYLKQFPVHCGFKEKISAFTLLAQRNVITLTMSAQGNDIIYAKVGEATAGAARYSELSLSKMFVYIPALVQLEKICDQCSLTTENWAAWFGSFLERQGIRKELERLFREFVKGTYNGGYKLKDYLYMEKPKVGSELYRKQQYYQEQVAVFFRKR